MRFLADESCDFRVVVALRAAGHDVEAICQARPGAPDREILDWARREGRIVLAEDKDFGQLVFASLTGGAGGVVLIHCPEAQRFALPDAMVEIAAQFGSRLEGSFLVWSPDRVRIRRI
ncbi:MAG: DUF5615 family PIN-like protein [Thermoanaerobaculia bacterium]